LVKFCYQNWVNNQKSLDLEHLVTSTRLAAGLAVHGRAAGVAPRKTLRGAHTFNVRVSKAQHIAGVQKCVRNTQFMAVLLVWRRARP
jgi:hypothetical protein